MCGISGILSLKGDSVKFLDKRINLMTQMLHHRGPDQEGIYISKKRNFGLSNNRLSIVAPKEKFALPFTKNNRDFLSFNGEIYNFEELKNLLKAKGVKFVTGSDTEVLYEFLRTFNTDNLQKLNGMWSFAYYNEDKHELLLSRDLMGERHLFYTVQDNELIFSSEVKPILAASLNTYEFDFDSLITSWKFNSSSPGKTLIKNIFRLKSGNNLKFSSNNIKVFQFQKLQPEKWFDFFNTSPSISLVNEKFEEIFSNEVKLRLPKDVSFYTPLSGGIDSTVLADFIKKFVKNLHTFFAISDPSQTKAKNNDKSELQSSYYIAKKLNLIHTSVNLFDMNTRAVSELKYAAENGFDGCLCSGVPLYSMLSKYVSSLNHKVMMFAEGPDELLGGYLADIDSNAIDNLFASLKYLGNPKNLFKNKLVQKIIIKLLNLKKNREFEFNYDPFYTRVNHLVCPNKFLNLITKNYEINKHYEYGLLDPIYRHLETSLDNSQKRALIYASKTLPDMFNLRTDKAFYTHSVEVRLPYQAINLVEFFIAMPKKYRFGRGYGKVFLRNYTKNKIDKYISKKPKIGMGISTINSEKNRKLLHLESTIMNTDFFSYFPFKKNIKKILLDKNTHPGNKWIAYSLIKTFENMKRIENANFNKSQAFKE